MEDNIKSDLLNQLLKGGLLAGNVKMRPPKIRVPPYWEVGHKFAERNTNFSQVKIYVREPVFQWPTASVFFLVQTGNGYAAVRCNDADEITNLSIFLSQAAQTAKAKLTELEPKVKAVEEALRQYALAQQTSPNGHQEED